MGSNPIFNYIILVVKTRTLYVGHLTTSTQDVKLKPSESAKRNGWDISGSSKEEYGRIDSSIPTLDTVYVTNKIITD